MSATAESHVKEATLTWLDERGYAIPARRAAPGDRGLPSAGFAIHSQLTSPPNPADKATRLDIYTPLLVTVKVRDVDRYGRLVADAILSDGRNLGHELMQVGMAWWYRSTPATMQPWQGSKPRRRPRSVGCGVIRMPWRRGRGASAFPIRRGLLPCLPLRAVRHWDGAPRYGLLSRAMSCNPRRMMAASRACAASSGVSYRPRTR